jgi:type IV secretion system protein VirB10
VKACQPFPLFLVTSAGRSSTQDRGQPRLHPGRLRQSRHQPAEEQRRLQEIETARTSRLFSGSESRGTPAAAELPQRSRQVPDLASIGLAPPPATPSAQDRQNAFLNAAADRRRLRPIAPLRQYRRTSFRREQ